MVVEFTLFDIALCTTFDITVISTMSQPCHAFRSVALQKSDI